MRHHCRHGSKAALIILAAVAFVAAAACSSKSSSSSSNSSNSSANAAALGTPNKATGTPIKIGFIDDGKTAAVDNSNYGVAGKATAEYANDYLGGINGHPIEIDSCAALGTPSGATQCGIRMVNDKVAAVIVPTLTNDVTVFTAMNGSGIPYLSQSTGSQDILLKSGAFVFSNPVGLIGAPALLAKEQGIKKVADVIIDVPAATGPITAIAKPIFQKQGVGLNIVAISPSVADQSPQIQQAISAGAGMFVVTGDEPFDAKAIKSIKQLGFTGPIVTGVSNPSADTIASIPGGFEGVTNLGTTTTDPSDKDVQLFNAVMQKYGNGGPPDYLAETSFAVTLGLVRALTGVNAAVDAPSITAALNGMPAPLPLPLGGGITFQCGAKLVAVTPNVCTAGVLVFSLDQNAKGSNFKVIDTKSLLG